MVIKVISLNMWWGGNLLSNVLDFLKREQADIVALQEVHDGHDPDLLERQRSMEVLRRELAYPHDDFAQAFVHDAAEGRVPLGNAILSRFPIEKSEVRFFVKPDRELYQDVPGQWPIFPRLLQLVKIALHAGEINLGNIHGAWDLDGDNDSAERRRMVQTILDATSDLPNVIITGDTNAKHSNPAMRVLETKLKPVFAEDLKSTFNMRRKTDPGYATAAVDLMYVSPDIQVVSQDYPDVDVSDHLPLVASLQID